MLIISENELLHTDNCQDVIEHFGTKGMKWGVRKTKAYAKSFVRNKYNGKFVDDRIAAKKKYKEDKKAINEKYSKLEDKIGTMKGSKDKIARLENRNSEQHMAALKKLKAQYKMSKKERRRQL